MSYALETKKRKFDRLLESLSEPVPPPKSVTNTSSFLPSLSTTSTTDRTPLYSRKTPSSAITSLSDSLKRRRITPISLSTSSKTSTAIAAVDLRNVYLPSSRPAFLARLESFRHVTKWHIPSTGAINAAEWAKCGWCCVDVDTVGCGTCGERVVVDLGPEDAIQPGKENIESTQNQKLQDNAEGQNAQDDDEHNVQAQIYDALVNRYREITITGHAESCLWRRRACDSSIQRIQGLLNATTAVNLLRTRYEGIKEKIDEVSRVVMCADTQRQNSIQVNDSELQDLDLDFESDHKLGALRLALCGWQRKDAEVVECQHCFRSLGLWLYRGEEPAIEHLDAVDSHLEYCPWRSAGAQDTEIPIPNTGWVDGQQQKAKYPGWVLVYLAVLKHNAKKKGGLNASTLSLSSSANGSSIRREDLSPEQREKRMKDLMKRIKEIKKPFNVKALLRKKTTTA